MSTMESDITSCLKSVLKENIDQFSIKIVGSSEKGEGYVGDIVFVSLIPRDIKTKQEYHLVLKCSKRSQKLREKVPVREIFLNEIYVYEQVFPTFGNFQQEKAVQNVFNSVPKCLGKFTTEDTEVIVLEDLKKIGYELWNKKMPLTRKHVTMVVEEYAKFHSVSIAMRDQQPRRFQELIKDLKDVLRNFLEATGVVQVFGGCIDEIADLLKDDLDEDMLTTWQSLKDKVLYIVNDMVSEQNGLRVILHGDCWCNNFMFQHDEKTKTLPVKVAILDWQVSRYASPILDLSYFLFAGISKDDLEHLTNILDYYYEQLKLRCRRLGTNLEALYPRSQFFEDWKKYCKFGIMMASVALKLCITEKDEVRDLAQTAESSKDFENAFVYEVKNKNAFKERARDMVKYVVQNRLI